MLASAESIVADQQYTHWKQTVFYTPETITVSVRLTVGARTNELTVQEGETIRGELSCAPNSRNNRDLDIVIDWEVEGQEPCKGSMTYKMCVGAVTTFRDQQLNAGHKLSILSYTRFPCPPYVQQVLDWPIDDSTVRATCGSCFASSVIYTIMHIPYSVS